MDKERRKSRRKRGEREEKEKEKEKEKETRKRREREEKEKEKERAIEGERVEARKRALLQTELTMDNQDFHLILVVGEVNPY